MGSKSSSNQSTTYNTSTQYTYNQLDGGAINSAFNFANKHSDRALKTTDNAVNRMYSAVSSALSSNDKTVSQAFSFGEDALDYSRMVTGEAFDSVSNTFEQALNHSSNQLDQMSDLVKSTQTQGATELINANKETAKVMYITIGVVLVMLLLMIMLAGRKR